MRSYAHPLGGDKWCNESQSEPDTSLLRESAEQSEPSSLEKSLTAGIGAREAEHSKPLSRAKEIEHAQDMRFCHEWLLLKEQQYHGKEMPAYWQSIRTQWLAGLWSRLRIRSKDTPPLSSDLPDYPAHPCPNCGGDYWLTDKNQWLCQVCNPKPS
tara:strand:+ start:1618 stop:2082 length:465 start_codon:yes stop_codon:yes gene_type:complete